jgi:hypothetical protein
MFSVDPIEKTFISPALAFSHKSVSRGTVNNSKLSRALINPTEGSPGDSAQKGTSGFSLIECLISLSLSLFIFISAVQIFSHSKKIFYRLKAEHEATLGAVTALEKIREDLETAGAGFILAAKDSESFAISTESGNLLMFSKEARLTLAEEIESNQNFLMIVPDSGSSSSLRKGRALLIKDNQKEQIIYITGISGNYLTVSPAVAEAYNTSEAELLLLEKIEVYFDSKQKILRRKVNDTSGQPLAESINNFEVFYDPEKNLVQISLSLNQPEEKNYELVVYPKNIIKS